MCISWLTLTWMLAGGRLFRATTSPNRKLSLTKCSLSLMQTQNIFTQSVTSHSFANTTTVRRRMERRGSVTSSTMVKSISYMGVLSHRTRRVPIIMTSSAILRRGTLGYGRLLGWVKRLHQTLLGSLTLLVTLPLMLKFSKTWVSMQHFSLVLMKMIRSSAN